MKKVMLVLAVMLMAGSVYGGWFRKCDKDKQQIKVGQIWKRIFSGDSRKVLEVGEKYVVFGYLNGGDIDFPSVNTKEDFRDKYELVETAIEGQIRNGERCLEFYDGSEWQKIEKEEPEKITITITNVDTGSPPQEEQKPYLYKNPNNDHWICSKHGDLESNDFQFYFATRITISAIEGKGVTYCQKCYWETQVKLLDQYIIGVKE